MTLEKGFEQFWNLFLSTRGFAVSDSNSNPNSSKITLIEKEIKDYENTIKKLEVSKKKKGLRSEFVDQFIQSILFYNRKISDCKSKIKTLTNLKLSSSDYRSNYKKVLDSLKKSARIDKIELSPDNKTLKIYTKELFWNNRKNQPLGKFLINLYTNYYNPQEIFRVENLDYSARGYYHPHVNSSGGMCTGNYLDDLQGYSKEAQIYFFIDTIICILERPGSGSNPFIMFTDWNKFKVKRNPTPKEIQAKILNVGDRIKGIDDSRITFTGTVYHKSSEHIGTIKRDDGVTGGGVPIEEKPYSGLAGWRFDMTTNVDNIRKITRGRLKKSTLTVNAITPEEIPYGRGLNTGLEN